MTIEKDTAAKYFKAFQNHDMNAIRSIPPEHITHHAPDLDGYTPFHYAVLATPKENAAALRYFIERYPQHINVQDFQSRSPIFVAVMLGLPLAACLLLEAGADIHLRQPSGRSLLQFMNICVTNKHWTGKQKEFQFLTDALAKTPSTFIHEPDERTPLLSKQLST